jgi:hypothetical protein
MRVDDSRSLRWFVLEEEKNQKKKKKTKKKEKKEKRSLNKVCI